MHLNLGHPLGPESKGQVEDGEARAGTIGQRKANAIDQDLLNIKHLGVLNNTPQSPTHWTPLSLKIAVVLLFPDELYVGVDLEP